MLYNNNHRQGAASCIHHCVYVCVCACMRAHTHACMFILHASTCLLQSLFSTRLVMYVSDLRLLHGILLADICLRDLTNPLTNYFRTICLFMCDMILPCQTPSFCHSLWQTSQEIFTWQFFSNSYQTVYTSVITNFKCHMSITDIKWSKEI